MKTEFHAKHLYKDGTPFKGFPRTEEARKRLRRFIYHVERGIEMAKKEAKA